MPTDTTWGADAMSNGWDGDLGWNLGTEDLSPTGEVPFDFGSNAYDSASDWNTWFGSFNDNGSSTTSGNLDGTPSANPGVTPPDPADAPMTLATLGLPPDPPIGHRREKSYELHTITTTLTTGFDVYTLGVTVESTYLTDASVTGDNPVVKGDGKVKFTFQKVAEGLPPENPDPVWDTWLVDTSVAPTTPTAPAVSANPFASQLPAVGSNWDKVEIVDQDTQLTNGLYYDKGLEYWYSSDNRSNSDTVITTGAATADGDSTSSVRVSGDYSNTFTAGDWKQANRAARQGTMTADNRSSATFAQNQSITTTYANGIAISQRVTADGRIDGTDQTKVNLRSYSDQKIDDYNSLNGQVDRVIDTSGTTTGRNTTDLKLAPVAGSPDWSVTEGTQSSSLDTKKTIVQDWLKSRDDFQRGVGIGSGISSVYETGFDQTETSTTAGLDTSKSTSAYHKAPGAAAADLDQQTDSRSFTRHETAVVDGSNTYSRQTFLTPTSDATITDGVSTSSIGTEGNYTDKSESITDSVASTRIDTSEWNRSGTDRRMLGDEGKTVNSTTAGTTEYNNVTDLAGPTVSVGKIVSEYPLTPTSAALMGTMATTAPTKITSDTDSSAKLAGVITVSEKSYGPNRYTVTLNKQTTFGDNDNTQSLTTAGLVIVNGAAQSGTIRSETVTLGSDSIDKTTSGTMRTDNGLTDQTETMNRVEKWWGTVTAGTDATTILYVGGVAQTHTLQNDASNGGSTISGSYSLERVAPTKTVAITLWTPTLARPGLSSVSSTFDNARQRSEFKIGDAPQTGGYTKTTKSSVDQTVTASIANDLTAPDKTGSEVWTSVTHYREKNDDAEGQEALDGAWDGLQQTFDDSVYTGRSGTHTLDSSLRAGTKTQEIVTVRESGWQSVEDKFVGQRGRGPETAKETVTTKGHSWTLTTINAGLLDYQLPGVTPFSSGGKYDLTREITSNIELVQNYEWTNGIRALKSVTPSNTNRTSDIIAKREVLGTGSYSFTHTERSRDLNGAVGQVQGWRTDYTLKRTKEKADGLWSQEVETPTGSKDQVWWVQPQGLDWWDDTWVNAAWHLAGDTVQGRVASWTWNHGQEVAQIGFGVFDVALGASMIWTGAGTIPGGVLIAVGIDQIAAGSLKLRYGRTSQSYSLIENGVYWATGNETVAILAPGVLSLGVGSFGSFGRAGIALRPGESVVTGSGGLFSRLRGTTISNEGDVLLYTGTQQARAQRLAEEAARIARVHLGDYVDDVVLISRNISGNRVSPWFDVINGRRTLALTAQTLARPQVGRLIDTLHELNHARQAQRIGYQRYFDMYNTSLIMQGRIEILVQSRAIRQALREFGSINPRILTREQHYVDQYLRYYFDDLTAWFNTGRVP